MAIFVRDTTGTGLTIWNLKVQKNLNIEKIAFKVVQMKFLWMKIIIWYICGWKFTKHLHGTWSLLNIKSNQITFIVTSPQHKCLGEWNSYERAPDSAEKQQTIYLWTDSAKKKTTAIYIWTDSAKKQQQFTYGQYIFTDCTEDNVQNTHTYTQYT